MLEEFADSNEVNSGRILKEDEIYGQHRRRKRFMQAAAAYGEDTAAADYSDVICSIFSILSLLLRLLKSHTL